MKVPAAKPAAATKNQKSRRPASNRINPKTAETIFIPPGVIPASRTPERNLNSRCAGYIVLRSSRGNETHLFLFAVEDQSLVTSTATMTNDLATARAARLKRVGVIQR